jgi:hypothetical protein
MSGAHDVEIYQVMWRSYWLEFFESTSLADSIRVEQLLVEAKELRSIFAASSRTATRNHRGKGTQRS